MARSRSGYTLIELVVVLAILGLVFAMGITRIDFLVPKYRLRAAAREMGATLKQASSKAASSGRDVYIRILLSESRYELLIPVEKPNPAADGFPPGTPKEQLPPPEWVYEPVMGRELPEGVRFVNVVTGPGRDGTRDSGVVLVRATPYGLSDHLIANFALEEKRLAVRLNGLTGLLTFHDEEQGPSDLLEDQP